MSGVSSAAVSRVLNYDESISVSNETRAAIFAAAEKVGYKKRVIYPKIDHVALICFTEMEDELEDIFYQDVKDELLKQAKKMNIHLTVYNKSDGIHSIPKDLSAFIAVGWLNRKEIDALYKRCKKGVFIGTSPDEKLFDAVRPNMDSFVTQIVDYFMEHGHRTIGFIGGPDRNIDTGLPSMDIREWSFRQSAAYYGCLNDDYILISNKFTVEEGYRMGERAPPKGTLSPPPFVLPATHWRLAFCRLLMRRVSKFRNKLRCLVLTMSILQSMFRRLLQQFILISPSSAKLRWNCCGIRSSTVGKSRSLCL